MKQLVLLLAFLMCGAVFPLNAKDRPKAEDFRLSARVAEVSDGGSAAETIILLNLQDRRCGLRIEDIIYSVSCGGKLSSTALTIGKVFPARFKDDKRKVLEMLVPDKKGKQFVLKYKVKGVKEALKEN